MEGLVERARAGDLRAFERLVEERIEDVYQRALAILGDPGEADDATQATFVTVWRRIGQLREPRAFDAWLSRIVLNACRMRLRARRRLREVPLSEAGDPVDSPLAAGVFDRAFERLSVEQRYLLVEHHLEGRPIAEIAETLGIPAGTVKSRLHAARRSLERALAEERK